MTTELMRRSFYLMMGSFEGFDLAGAAGMVPPSEDVAQAEHISVAREWALFEQAGVLDSIAEGASWFADISTAQELEDLMDPEQLERVMSMGMSEDEVRAQCHVQVARSMAALGVAFVHKLMSEGLVELTEGC